MQKFLLAAGAALALSASAAVAGPTYSFSLNQSDVSQLSGGVGTVTLTQHGTNSVDVLVDLSPTGSGANFGFLNTGGPHTPFVFDLANTNGLSIAFTQPTGGNFTNGSNFSFSLNPSGGSATPYGTFTGAIDITPVKNGSSAAYFGDLAFTLTRTSGLDTTDFIQNDTTNKAYFAADITDLTCEQIVSVQPEAAHVPNPSAAATRRFSHCHAAGLGRRAGRLRV